jgi:hypothetical protein
MILKSKQIGIMKFLDYIFYRSYINLYKTKHKDMAEARSIGFVFLYSLIILFSVVITINFIFDIYNFDHHVDRRTLAIFVIPITLIAWHFVERYYRKFSKSNYEVLRDRFDKSKYNKIIPFWLVFIFPFVLLFGVPFILSVGFYISFCVVVWSAIYFVII